MSQKLYLIVIAALVVFSAAMVAINYGLRNLNDAALESCPKPAIPARLRDYKVFYLPYDPEWRR